MEEEEHSKSQVHALECRPALERCSNACKNEGLAYQKRLYIPLIIRPKVGRMAAERGDNKSRDRWRRGVFFANRLQDGNFTLDGADLQPEENAQLEKHLETQHWLELIDG